MNAEVTARLRELHTTIEAGKLQPISVHGCPAVANLDFLPQIQCLKQASSSVYRFLVNSQQPTSVVCDEVATLHMSAKHVLPKLVMPHGSCIASMCSAIHMIPVL